MGRLRVGKGEWLRMGEEGTVVRVVERGMSGGCEKRREGFTVGKGGMVRGGGKRARGWKG